MSSDTPSIREVLEVAEVPAKERAYTRASMPDHLEPFRARAAAALGQKRSVILQGPPGRGKTGLAVVCLRRILEEALGRYRLDQEQGLPTAAFVLVPDYVKELREAVARGHWGREEEVVQADWLIFDDFGAGWHTDYGVEETKYVLHKRLSWLRPTIVTTTLTAEEVEARYGKPTLSRLREYYTVRLPEELPDLREER